MMFSLHHRNNHRESIQIYRI